LVASTNLGVVRGNVAPSGGLEEFGHEASGGTGDANVLSIVGIVSADSQCETGVLLGVRDVIAAISSVIINGVIGRAGLRRGTERGGVIEGGQGSVRISMHRR
jgi:hypothetical protein